MRNIHPFEVPSSHVEFLLDAHRFPEATSMAFYGETLETKGPPPSQGVTVDEQFAEHQEHHFKKEAWGHVKAWSKATGVTMNILGYRGRVSALHLNCQFYARTAVDVSVPQVFDAEPLPASRRSRHHTPRSMAC